MRRIVFIFLCVIFTNFQSWAQGPNPSNLKEVTISGKVIDIQDKSPLEYATIAFFSKALNKIVTGGITDTKGEFKIKVPQGLYDISVEFISYKTKTYPDKQLSKDMNLGTVGLELDIEALGEVEIIAERTTVEIKLDKKIYNVGKDLTVRGGTVSDVLDNVPSVSVDVEGNVSLRGNDNVRILINGKPSGLVGLNSTDALRQLPAESIQRVEVITSPSARYDAEGTAGILNIILRRSKLQGLNGAITVNAGEPLAAGISGNINYRTGDVNIFNTSGYSYREVPGNTFNDIEFFNDEEPSTFSRETRTFDRIRKGFNTNLGVEWYVTDNTSITTSLFYRNSDNESNTINIIDRFNPNMDLINQSIRKDPELEDDKTIQYAINFDKQFKGNSEHRLTADFQYENSKEVESSLVSEDGVINNKVITDENQDRILLRADYVQPVNETGSFELGYRGEFQDLVTDYFVGSSDDNGISFETNVNQTNILNFKQQVNAVYSQYGNKIGKKFSYLLGLRFENTRITIDQETSNEFKKKSFAQLFPTLNLSYELSDKENITFGYNRRIRRARSWFINPFPSLSSVTNIFQGNPDLDPTTSDAFDIGYLKRFGKLTLNASVYFQHAANVFNFARFGTDDYYFFEIAETVNINSSAYEQLIQLYQPVQVIRTTPINLATNDRFGFEFTLSYRASKKWNVNGNFNLFNSKTRGDFNGQNFDADNLSWFIRLNNKYTLPGNIEWQTRMFYRGPSETAQSKSRGIFSTDLAFSKDLFNDKASLAFRVSDLFNSRKRISDNLTPDFASYSEFQWRERSFNLSFTYRFNQKKKRGGQRGNGNGEDFEFQG